MTTDLPARGELWWSEIAQVGPRPGVVLSRNAAIIGRRRTMVAFCSTQVRGLPTEVLLEPGKDPVTKPSVVQVDAVTDVAAGQLIRRMGRLTPARMQQVCAALAIAVDCS